jgi:hypothetical protein
MIDTENLRTASLYINNQLLSRGLLRDGRDIEFADPGEGEFSTAESASRIISILNDLIIRRDVCLEAFPPCFFSKIGHPS